MSKYRTFKLNKLVRDRIIELTEAYGGKVHSEILSGEKLRLALINKLIEEAQELKTSEISAAELADLQEILDELIKNLGHTKIEIHELQDKKRTKNGGFSKGLFIETLSAPADNKWADYYGAEPDKYPEIKKNYVE